MLNPLQIISLLILAPLFWPAFTFCPFKMPYLYCFACPVRCFWHRIRGVVLLIALGVNIKNGLFCAQICPFGTIQVILSRIKSKKLAPPEFLKKIKYLSVILILLIIAITRMPQLPGQILIIRISGLLLAIFLLSIIASIFSYRFFCQTACPLAALSSALRKIKPK